MDDIIHQTHIGLIQKSKELFSSATAFFYSAALNFPRLAKSMGGYHLSRLRPGLKDISPHTHPNLVI